MQTLDFITPIVDDPYIFGQIAAANSLSDVFAMGGRVLNALNIVGFDDCHFGGEILSEILRGGKDKIVESGGVLVGGHTISTPEIYYGLSVTGSVNPSKFYSNNTAKIGDLLILTKPIGTGLIATAIKAKMFDVMRFEEAIESMRRLNLYAVEALYGLDVSACTDVTGFGLLGHLSEMLNDNISFEIYPREVPYFGVIDEILSFGLIPAGDYKNLDFVKKFTNKEPDIWLCDAQTSGGLLIAINEKDAPKALQNLKNAGYERSAIIGKAIKKSEFGINIA